MTTDAQLSDGNLWLHFTRTSDWISEQPTVPVIARGEGCYVWDSDGNRYLDALSALFCAQLGYGRQELVDAATAQLNALPFATNWGLGTSASDRPRSRPCRTLPR